MEPIFHLHGGPGSNFNEKHKILYDPQKHRVIFHDQRGCGKSVPFAETTNNTTQDLVQDIEKLREHFGIEKFVVSGGSWGSTLALVYAIAHPEHVARIVLWSVFLDRQFEIDWVNEGYPRYFFPQEWNRFVSHVSEEYRTNGNAIMKYYAEQINSEDEAVAIKFAREWMLWECVLLSIVYDPVQLEKEVFEDDKVMSVSRLETHYFSQKCFLPENYILDNIGKIKHIPCVLVQGRFDMCTPPISALDLRNAYGDKLVLRWVNSGHSRTDPEMLTALKAELDALVF